jgi:predicted nuclease with RNAse H fold
MAKPPHKLVSKTSEESHAEKQRAIAKQTELFLQRGGAIERIANGVSGQVWVPSRHIKLDKKPSST